ncbi:alpha/beta hydrolase [Kutzneria kofuensis]|uniref:Acetyl esterase/lipase n=1 Tax=Kutzneria kofuensis TaxID=103725 RepID=A0A7W9NGF7_9PSEU|nr:alpha/beta hydrolase [Kutzneria kofuensis]MBB5891474.1 acetyl esterase/lipase [Kutzneria kofuensis]
MPHIDPELERFVEAFPVIRVSAPGVDVVRVRDDLHQRWQRMQPMVQVGEVTDMKVPVPVRVYKPVLGAVDLPVVVFMHGGGWCTGGLVTHDDLCRRICRSVQAVVVSVDYRLAPEHPFPAAVDDSFAVLRWVGEHAREIGGDPSRIAVAGDSAGGNLAAVLAQLARDEGGPALRFQLLLYPSVGGVGEFPSRAENTDAPVLSTPDMEAYLRYYAGHLDGAPPATLAPALAADLSGLPPAFIATVWRDPLRDEGEAYARQLQAAGVPVDTVRFDHLVHSFASYAPLIPAASDALEQCLSALRKGLLR